MNGNPRDEKVTARIIFRGVMLTCINRQKQYEVGMIRCPVHEPTITIQTTRNGVTSARVPVDWPKGHDLLFQVINPEEEGVSIYPRNGHDTDFERVIDLEGENLHSEGVTVQTDKLQGRRLGVTAGKLYTHKLSDVEFNLLTWTNENEEGEEKQPLGKVADEIGLNVFCRPGGESGISIIDLETRQPVENGSMPAVPGTTYTIEILNDCREGGSGPGTSIGTDFRFYYDFITPNDESKYDLGFETDESEEEPPPSPDACENTYLSQTDTLGLTT